MDYIVGDMEDMHQIGDNSMDAVIWCSVLCSVNSPTKALKEVIRVLKPGGHVYFSEHCLYPGGACRLNRKSCDDIERCGFRDLTINHVFRDNARDILMNHWIWGHGLKP
ncbi:unnamed protein product [Oppiella nova]|uniref:Methyltransferase type 11 domain-containing protein n=1 Tax=Oppiella nova TaxID=334625 RepID=A0A7R9MGB2_9ACAR|nr:unnamed protein product [Oppiella nova]CAG2176671.1 unnamed protein product [Oppiella nova]